MNSNSIALDCSGSNLRDHGIEAHSSPAAGSGVIVHGTSFEQEYYLIYLWWTNIHENWGDSGMGRLPTGKSMD